MQRGDLLRQISSPFIWPRAARRMIRFSFWIVSG